ncbi:UDP-2,4-diacetamido-2,4,6-trideoxy-beta-L-altropyranose hydrolase [Glaciecola petra]|uniref:UDP-2,4-diacetamido-2,4, 6-trideoxy-beta-L-altropyranose hydrolase n=1 Tax=Glaciecola petra TaxID=3075602 RepID=A0ABU2ZM00_9ALTE|nr:UDP-2,4-diacetamido-2,4,6-trideoxy-beta-L-altropyranose hydrolase [Aestuariibacter sp. P117]MDT0593650.1 UDP-2,4-diacetamido-2,4,6-trideoxy-beta-L-altropyranose hydrolase [Aestuariibacter sp. P117]
MRADASDFMGSGHIMRCLTLAEALAKKNVQTTFICRDWPGHMQEQIEARGFPVVLLPSLPLQAKQQIELSDDTTWLGCDFDTDAQQTINALKTMYSEHACVDLLVVDHYGIDIRWESLLQKYYRQLFVIDDLANKSHICDVLLDQTFQRQSNDYHELVPKDSRILCGTKYALLKETFTQLPVNVINIDTTSTVEPLRIFIFLGGSDPLNKTAEAITAITAITSIDDTNAGIHIDLVLGAQNKHADAISKIIKNSLLKIQVYRNVENMAELMSHSDIAIGAAGTSSWERCCLGLPSLVFVYADNQSMISEQLLQANAVKIWKTAEELNQQVQLLLNDASLRKEMSLAAKKVCDGKGTERVVNALLSLITFK